MDKMIATVAPLQLEFPVLISPPMQRNGPWTAKSDTQNRTHRVNLILDPTTGAILQQVNFRQHQWVDRIVGTGVAAHEGHLFGWLNQIVSLSTALGLILISISAVILWWRRRPEGILGAPIPLGRPRFTYGFAALMIMLGVYLPLFGLSLLFVAIIERCILRRLPRAQQWLGLSGAV
jgi:uncharacterized iron-regulated membrane protein